MEFTFQIQDPLDPTTKYLYEAIIEQLGRGTVSRWRGMYSFATGNGVESLFYEDPVVRQFISGQTVELLIGIDSITDTAALQKLKELGEQLDGFQVQVFRSSGATLFHPKLSSFFEPEEDRVTVILGSGNLTPGGLRTNTEAYAIITGTSQEMSSLSAWDRFMANRLVQITGINERAMERASENELALRRRGRRAEEDETRLEELADETGGDAQAEIELLAATVPSGGDRWHQIHFNADVIDQFIQMRPNSEQRAFLRSVDSSGNLGPEEQRPLVFSEANKNYKIEMASHRGIEYPVEAPPVLLMKKVGVRIFHYMILFQEDNGYEQIARFIQDKPAVGRGLPRVLSTVNELSTYWPDCPLI